MTSVHQTRKKHIAQARNLASTIRPRVRQWAYLLLAGLVLPTSVAWAQTKPTTENSAAKSGGYVGLGINVAPRYQGADESRTSGIPGFEYHWANGLFAGGTEGFVGFQFNAASQTRLGLALGLDEGRKASDSRYLAGMGDVVERGTLNMYAKSSVTDQLELSAGLRLGSGNSAKGSLLNLAVSYGFSIAPATSLSVSVGASLANADYMRDYFGVSDAQASATGYKRFTPASGLREATVGLGVQHQIRGNWMLMASVSSTALSNVAKASPLVRKATTQSAFAALAYSF